MNLLVADIGGTNARFASFEIQGSGSSESAPQLIQEQWLETESATDFASLLSDALSGFDCKDFSAGVFAVAGPIENNVYSDPPNISWDIDLRSDAVSDLLPEIFLINDFLAQAYAVISPLSKSLDLVKKGEIQAAATKAVLGAGTGLGKAILVPDVCRQSFVGVASEGGHASFPFSPSEREFEQFLREKHSLEEEATLSIERVLSGTALSHLYEFHSGEQYEPSEVPKHFDSFPEVLQNYSRFFARSCRNFALETLSLGGLYVAGGVAAKNPLIFEQENFLREFTASDIHGDLLEQIPIYLFDDQSSGLWGAAMYGALRSGQSS